MMTTLFRVVIVRIVISHLVWFLLFSVHPDDSGTNVVAGGTMKGGSSWEGDWKGD